MTVSNRTGLVADVTNGVLNYQGSEETTSETKRGSSELGKDAFLQLLVCQMQNQDPLEPSTDTEYVAQLAQFSQLEQLQNLSSTTETSQAFSLVGRYVIFQCTDSAGKTTYPEGIVDFVNVSGKKVSLSVNGNTYNFEDIYTVVDNEFYISQNVPKVDKAYNYIYNGLSPEDMSFEIDLGKGPMKASEVALVVGGVQLDGSYITYRNDKVIVNSDAFKEFENGDYPVSVIFNNSLFTTVSDKITVSVFNSQAAEKVEQ